MKKRLLIPGPVELSPEVRASQSKPIMGHRTPDFNEILEDCWNELKEIYQTKNDVAIITGSGTSAMDASIASTVSSGDEVICIGGGKFGERFPKIVEAYGGKPIDVPVEWGKSVAPEDVKKAVSNSNAVAITLTHNETSTGVIHDAKAIGQIAREHKLLFIMDAITSLGGDVVKTDAWGVDICISGSQKCLGAPPGLGFAAVSDKAWKVIDENSEKRGFYLDLSSYKKSISKSTTPFTPAVSLIYGLKTALAQIKEEGIENRILRHHRLANATRNAAKAMNLELFADESCASNTVTAIKIPDGLTDNDVRGRMKEDFGILLAGGQDSVKGKIFRIGHMANVDEVELLGVISALELVLAKAGHDNAPGNGPRAAIESFF